MRRIIKYVLLIWFTYSPVQLLGNNHNTEPGNNIIEGEAALRIFLKHNKTSVMGEFKGRIENEDHEFHYHSVTIGPYYRIINNLKLGLFYRLQRGAWHDDDWIKEDGQWFWRDTDNRNEHLFIGDVTPRFSLPFLPGKNWVFELKNRYYYNTFNEQQTITTRPGITYFYIDGLTPIINVSIQYELYIPLNYGTKTIYEQWLYTNILYHATNQTKVGIYGAYKKITWGTSEDFKELFPNEKHEVTKRSFVIGLTAQYIIKFK